MTVAQRQNVAGMPIVPDGTIDAADRAAIAGLPTLGSGSSGITVTNHPMASFMLSCMEAILQSLGETLTYRPRVGLTRTIYGVVDRRLVAGIPGFTGGNTPMAAIAVKNSATGDYPGITSAEIDTGGDKIDYPIRPGEAVQSRRIGRILAMHEGALILEML